MTTCCCESNSPSAEWQSARSSRWIESQDCSAWSLQCSAQLNELYVSHETGVCTSKWIHPILHTQRSENKVWGGGGLMNRSILASASVLSALFFMRLFWVPQSNGGTVLVVESSFNLCSQLLVVTSCHYCHLHLIPILHLHHNYLNKADCFPRWMTYIFYAVIFIFKAVTLT